MQKFVGCKSVVRRLCSFAMKRGLLVRRRYIRWKGKIYTSVVSGSNHGDVDNSREQELTENCKYTIASVEIYCVVCGASY